MEKDIVLAISPEQGGGGGCWYHRVEQIGTFLNENPQYRTKFVMTPVPIFDPNLMGSVKCVFIQRPFSPMPWIKNYRELQPKYGYSLVFDVVDLWTEFEGNPQLPEYHPMNDKPRDVQAIDRVSREQLQYFDRGIVTTEALKRVLVEKFDFLNVVIVPNAANRSLYSMNRKDFFREVPVCSIPAAKQHNLEPIPMSPQKPLGQVGMRGDFNGEWVDWIKDKVNAKEIDFYQSAGQAYFFDEIKDKMQTSPWMDVPNYVGYTCRLRPDIIFAPLEENFFNKCKSSLRMSQAYALGAILIATSFKDGPYEHIHPMCRVGTNPTKEELEKVFNNVKEHWKEIVDWQYDFINKNGQWVESPDHVNKYLYAFAPQAGGII